MTRSMLIGPLIVAGAVVALAVVPRSSSAQTPDITELVATIDVEQLRAHIDAIDEPRNAFAQPEQLQTTADYVQSQFESFGYDVTLNDVTFGPATFPNVYAEQPGAVCADRTFIVGAHYDSVEASPGADDNASGVAGMLEMARALADTPLPATVRFVAFAMEEDGLIGSRRMAADLAAEDAQIIGMMSFDMIGYAAGDADFLVALGNTASVRQTDAVHRASATYLPDFTVVVVNVAGNGEQQPDSRRSDHSPFWDAGYQGMIVTDTANLRNPNYHQPSDTIDTLDFEFMANSTKAMLATTVDYLTYDGDDNGEADVCSGPLAATPTAPGIATEPSPTAETVRTPTPTAPPVLPRTGDQLTADNEWPPHLMWWLALGGAVPIGAAGVALRLRR